MNKAIEPVKSAATTVKGDAVLHCSPCNKTTTVQVKDELGGLYEYQCGCGRYLWRNGKAA